MNRKTRKQIVLSSAREAQVADAMHHFLAVGKEIENLDVLEYQALKEDAAKERRRPKPPRHYPEYSDAELLRMERDALAEYVTRHRKQPTRARLYDLIAKRCSQSKYTVRDRLLRARKNQGVRS
jgi:hypothetical protein